MMHKLDLTALITRIAGLGALAADATFQQAVTTLFGPYGTKIIAGVGLLALIAADIIRFNANPSVTAAEATPAAPQTTLPVEVPPHV